MTTSSRPQRPPVRSRRRAVPTLVLATLAAGAVASPSGSPAAADLLAVERVSQSVVAGGTGPAAGDGDGDEATAGPGLDLVGAVAELTGQLRTRADQLVEARLLRLAEELRARLVAQAADEDDEAAEDATDGGVNDREPLALPEPVGTVTTVVTTTLDTVAAEPVERVTETGGRLAAVVRDDPTAPDPAAPEPIGALADLTACDLSELEGSPLTSRELEALGVTTEQLGSLGTEDGCAELVHVLRGAGLLPDDLLPRSVLGSSAALPR